MVKLVRSIIAILVATVLIGAPGVQATITLPCQMAATNAAGHQQPASQAPQPMSSPCKEMMPGCTDMLGCGPSAGLLVQATAVAHRLVETLATYEAVADPQEGRSVKPYLGPPITA
jgi:hypothetical protein